jgi:hypothetical protein
MLDADMPRFAAEFLSFSAAFYPTRKIGPEVTLAYFDQLHDLGLVDVMRGLRAHCNDPQRSAFFPTPGDVRRGIESSQHPVNHLAFAQVKAEVRRVGRYGKPCLSGATFAAIRAVGGWGRLCSSANDAELETLGAEFSRALAVASKALSTDSVDNSNSTPRLPQ